MKMTIGAHHLWELYGDENKTYSAKVEIIVNGIFNHKKPYQLTLFESSGAIYSDRKNTIHEVYESVIGLTEQYNRILISDLNLLDDEWGELETKLKNWEVENYE